ncbi:MAG: putative metal-binding motif-containing protein [Myxococcota bacterium]|jgi:hypothetical protein|nr:putative metal-binding motif-containing protein [Myxococcota bacterium]
MGKNWHTIVGFLLFGAALWTVCACSSKGGAQNGDDTSSSTVDDDSDGWAGEWDCNDHDSDISPGVPEVPGNKVDDDCDGETDEADEDGTDTLDNYPGSVDTAFNLGSLIIPMDVDYQDEGMLKAYGLVYQLLLAKVNVYWLIKTPKEVNEVDFETSAKDVATGAVIPEHGYRGGPFAIAAADAPKALPVIEAWQSSHVTTVHQATDNFIGPVARILRKTPRIGILANGQEVISFGYMRAAGVPDSLGKEWPAKKDATAVYEGYPDVLSVAEVRGPTDTDDRDGVLFDEGGDPAFCELMTMHWDVEDRDEEAIAEIREYLSFPVHFFAECQSVNAVENAINGRFLTPNGYIMDEQPTAVDILNPYLPFSQFDGAFETVGGSEPSYSLPQGDSYFDDGVVMVTEAGTPLGTRDVWMTGYLDGACKIDDVIPRTAGAGILPVPGVDCPGKISYLGGHKYSTATPISENPDSQGTRFFLNALFEADCITSNQ